MENQNIIYVKWGPNKYTINISSVKTYKDLQNEISILSGVIPIEQKLIYKGKIIKEDSDLIKIPIKSTISMLGAAPKGQQAQKPKPEITFEEDLTEEQRLKILRDKGEEIVFGLVNLGNTCYLNASVQCLGRIKEFRNALKELSKSNESRPNDVQYMLALSLGSTYDQLDSATKAVTPQFLVNSVHRAKPEFAERDRGIPKQQDADECVSLIINSTKTYLKNNIPGERYSDNLISELFDIEMNIQLKNVSDETEVKNKKEILNKLVCYIDNSTLELVEGLKKSLRENIDLFSDKLQTNSVFEKTQFINRFPNYLIVQFMRFFWKKANEATGAKAGKAKILKSVLFSKVIDLYDMASEETKEILNLGRKIENKLRKNDPTFRIENVVKGPNDNMIPTGRYQLISVITHQGRSSDSGHYIGWVHKKDDKWLKYDDDNVTMVQTNDILELKGGGDWHMAYICFFKQLEVPMIDDIE